MRFNQRGLVGVFVIACEIKSHWHIDGTIWHYIYNKMTPRSTIVMMMNKSIYLFYYEFVFMSFFNLQPCAECTFKSSQQYWLNTPKLGLLKLKTSLRPSPKF